MKNLPRFIKDLSELGTPLNSVKKEEQRYIDVEETNKKQNMASR